MAVTPIDLREARTVVLAATLARGTSTLVAIRRLSMDGHGVQGLMLCRSLFEDALTATWIQVAAPKDLEHRYDLHMEMSRRLAAAAEGREPTPEEVEKALTKEERRLFGHHAHKSWTGRSSQTQVRIIDRSGGGSLRRSSG